MALGVLFFLVNLYFLGALMSEFNEFTGLNNSATQLLLVGLPVWMINLVLSLTMIYKYSKNGFKSGSQFKLSKQNI